MKAFKLFSTVLVLAVATTVTAGSMYITVRAAVQQQDSAVPAVAGDVIAATPAGVESPSRGEVAIEEQHSIVLDASGGFNGRLSSHSAAGGAPIGASEYTVRVLQRGRVVGNTQTDSEGRFTVTNLEPGVSGILAFSDNGLMLFGVQLVASDSAAAIAAIGDVVELDVDSTVVATGDIQQAREMILNALSGGSQQAASEVSVESDALAAGSGEASSTFAGHRVQPKADGPQGFKLQSDGTIEGEVVRLDGGSEPIDMTVYFLRNGSVVASAVAEDNGKFVVAGLNPGIHSVVATGKDGVYAVGIEILGSNYEPVAGGNTRNGEYIPAAMIQSGPLSIAPIGPGNLNSGNFQASTDETTEPEAAVAAAGAGPMGGGSFGGGGGGVRGGGGGLAGLLAGAAGAVGGYLAGQNNSDPPASP